MSLTNPKSITTKTGDQGMTRLFSGEQVLKTSLRIDAYGDVDEATSILGIARHHVRSEENQTLILFVQKSLSRICAELATTEEKLSRLKARVDQPFLNELEVRRERLESQVTIPNGFIVPAGSLAAAHLDHARTVVRRAERKVVQLLQAKEITNGLTLVWLNRLSDLLYLLARHEEGKPIYVKDDAT